MFGGDGRRPTMMPKRWAQRLAIGLMAGATLATSLEAQPTYPPAPAPYAPAHIAPTPVIPPQPAPTPEVTLQADQVVLLEKALGPGGHPRLYAERICSRGPGRHAADRARPDQRRAGAGRTGGRRLALRPGGSCRPAAAPASISSMNGACVPPPTIPPPISSRPWPPIAWPPGWTACRRPTLAMTTCAARLDDLSPDRRQWRLGVRSLTGTALKLGVSDPRVVALRARLAVEDPTPVVDRARLG